MRLKTPRWWYARPGSHLPLARTALTPLSLIWNAFTQSRIRRGRPVNPGVPVICVGNLTVGGAGKTPVAREIARYLRRAGVQAHILSRGHGGKEKGPLAVDPRAHTAADVGDEPLMLAADLPVWIARDRAAGARAAVAGGAQAIVMDDGHQNPSVKKALSLIVVDGETRHGEWPFGDEAVVPAGPMREPLAKGLARADAVVILLPNDVPEADPALLALFVAKPVLVARLAPSQKKPSEPVLAFAGVGKPWKVERALMEAGVTVAEFVEFPDHGVYDEKTLQTLQIRARLSKSLLMTTEKDWVRLSPAWRERVLAWPVQVKFDDEAKLEELLAGIGLIEGQASAETILEPVKPRTRRKPQNSTPSP